MTGTLSIRLPVVMSLSPMHPYEFTAPCNFLMMSFRIPPWRDEGYLPSVDMTINHVITGNLSIDP
jgi:hypothetical protein